MHRLLDTETRSQRIASADQIGAESDDEDLLLEMLMRTEGMIQEERKQQ